MLGFGTGQTNDIFTDLKDKACAKAVLLKDEYSLAVDRQVCTSQCPCPLGDKGANKALWEGYGDDFLRTFNRTSMPTETET